MKKNIILSFIVGLSTFSFAQENLVNQYPEELHQYNSGSALGGTARFQGMSGAMGALGGDLSATSINPAGAAVFLQSEGTLTAGVNMAKTKLNSNQGSDFSDSKINFDQAGAVLVFEDLQSHNWKNIAVGLNFQRQNTVNEAINLKPNTVASNGNKMTDYYSERIGSSSVTNLNVAANYNNNIYLGGGLNFHTYDADQIEAMRVDDVQFDNNYRFIKDGTPNSRLGTGISASLGVIAKINQQIRLGASYQSPTWYTDTEELTTQYAMFSAIDGEEEYYYIDRETLAYLNDLTTAQKFTGSAAVVIGSNGLISADYTYTDYSSAKFKPTDAFLAENAFISNNMKGTSTIKVGAEMRLQDFRLRGGYRYEQTPFEEVDLLGDGNTYQPFGDLSGFSLGLGYEFQSFYIDAAYSFYERDRNYLIAGNFYDYGGEISATGLTQTEALNALSLNASESGFAQSVKDITEQQGNIALTVGFRF
ncbi:hypothetical protein NMK71_04025 [Weeksellaceae bacterium KMM 9713]|uniref:Outer membrane protein transport protein (OMPP1/FadL/TodX) n=1 Tax=Profundicola chukchiensis TaxID=2961959 RepID=A0A9X4RUE0_9FLAO|nr:hypothetical protein [Profundicola chukchiensis]MDG4945571.1 hypothetical protein [Profundicola chukchiensis]